MMSLEQEKLFDGSQKDLSAVTLGGCRAVDQRKAEGQLSVRQGEIVSGSFGDVEGVLDLSHRGIIRSQNAGSYSDAVGVGNGAGVRQGVGVARHGDAVPQVVMPSRHTEAVPANGPRHDRER